jgi:hypothetical protein
MNDFLVIFFGIPLGILAWFALLIVTMEVWDSYKRWKKYGR